MAYNTQEEKAAYRAGIKKGQTMAGGVGGFTGPVMQQMQSTGQPANQPGNVKKPDTRFRSFAERYVIARAEFFRKDPEGLIEDQFLCLLDAKRVYLMARNMSINVEPED